MKEIRSFQIKIFTDKKGNPSCVNPDDEDDWCPFLKYDNIYDDYLGKLSNFKEFTCKIGNRNGVIKHFKPIKGCILLKEWGDK